ncbi:MAG: VIT1/CCC1 transporter family protein [Promethearchaeota archaeon]
MNLRRKKIKNLIKNYSIYAKISDLWPISRRYFVNNFYDGMLTLLGILLGFFVVILKGGEPFIESSLVIYTGLGTDISMFISGFSGSYLSERAEQKRIHVELKKAMGKYESNNRNKSAPPIKYQEEVEKAMLTPKEKRGKKRIKPPKKELKNGEVKTFHERAEAFAGKIVALINGGAPFLGGLIPLIPFFLVSEATFMTFLCSFFIIIICIILLGVFLGKISKTSILKNTLQMIGAFSITVLISILLLG